MNAAGSKEKGRILWLEALRIIAAFLVIVNHTNSDVFQMSHPGQLTWHLSILWYYVSKLAVPLFVMISGSVLLPRQDDLRKTLARVVRVLLALLAASYVYYLYDAWVNWGLWPRAVRLDILLGKILRMEITDGFWYLYFYLALLVTMPLWQWLFQRMTVRQKEWLMAACFFIGAGLPLLGHYVPALALPEGVMACIPVSYIGLLFAGAHVRKHLILRRQTGCIAAVVFVAALIFSWLLTWLEFGRVAAGEKYWFMDHRMIPALPVIAEAMAMMVLARCIGEGRAKSLPETDNAGNVQTGNSLLNGLIAELGGCAFGIYLAQDLLIAETEKRLFLPLCTRMQPMAAVLVWENVVFLLALAAVWLLRRIPFVRRIL